MHGFADTLHRTCVLLLQSSSFGLVEEKSEHDSSLPSRIQEKATIQTSDADERVVVTLDAASASERQMAPLTTSLIQALALNPEPKPRRPIEAVL